MHVLVAGRNARAGCRSAAKLEGVEKVLLADGDGLRAHAGRADGGADRVAAPGYDALVAPATTTGKNVMPRVAALLDVMQVSEIVKVIAPDTFERLIYAGNAIQTVQSSDPRR